MKKPYPIMEAFSFGWKSFKKSPKFWLIISLIMVITGGGAGFGGNIASNDYKDKYDQSIETNLKLVETVSSLDKRLLIVDRTYTTEPEISKLLNTTKPEKNNLGPVGIFLLITIGIVFGFIALFLGFFAALVSTVFSMGFTRLELDAVRGNELRYDTLLSIVDIKKSLKFLVVGILYALMVVFGLFLFIIPGIYFGTKYVFAPYSMIDKGLGIFESFSYSARLSKGIKIKLFLAGLFSLLLILLGFMAAFVGVFVTGIVVSLALAYLYEKARLNIESQESQANIVA